VINIAISSKFFEDYNPLNDFLFSKYMADKDCEEILLSFINALFTEHGEKIDDIKIISNKVIPVKLEDEKGYLLDLRAKSSTGEKIIIEIQQRYAGEFRNRSFHYICKEFCDSVKKVSKANYKKHILINIVNFEFNEGENFHQQFHCAEPGNCKNEYADLTLVHTIDLVKFRKLKEIDIKNQLHQWGIFFCKNEYLKEFKEVIKMNKSIKLADEKVKEVLSDGENERLYERLELKKHEIETEFKDAETRGKISEKKKIAISLLKKEYGINEVVDVTGLSIDEVQKLGKIND